MAEYIERTEAVEQIRLTYCKDCNNYNGILCRSCNFDDAMSAIEDCPAADVVSRKELIDAFEEYISEMTVSKWGTKFECETARSAVRMAVMFVLGERKEQT